MAAAIVDGSSVDFWQQRDLEALDECQRTCEKVQVSLQDWWILVNAQTQRLHLLQGKEWKRSYVVSTSKNGVGQEEGSGKTPLGWHRVQEKFGQGAAPYAVFESREQTGEMVVPNGEKVAIVARILRLGGLEDGYNREVNKAGKCVDSYERYIYIHGTNDEQNLGMAVSQGCIRMAPQDMVDLFDRVPPETPVYIYA